MNDAPTNLPERRPLARRVGRHLDVIRENLRRIDAALPLAPLDLPDLSPLVPPSNPPSDTREAERQTGGNDPRDCGAD